MFEKVIRAEKAEDLRVEIQLPQRYLHKHVKPVAFEVSNSDAFTQAKKESARRAVDYFKTVGVDMSNFKFDRNEAKERQLLS